MISASPVLRSYQAMLELVVPKSMPIDETCSLMVPNLRRGGLRRDRRRGSLQRFEPSRHSFDGLAYFIPLGHLFLGLLGPGFALAAFEFHRLLETGNLRLRLLGFLLDHPPHVLVYRAIQGHKVFVDPTVAPGRQVYVEEMPAHLLELLR